MSDKSSYDTISLLDAKGQKVFLESKARLDEKSLDLGLVGKILGAGQNSIRNITGMVVFVFTLTVVTLSFISQDKSEPYKSLEAFGPIITLCIGYLFGVREVKTKD